MKDALGAVQSVLVLGGGSEIGIAIARKLAGPRHANVVLAGRDPDALRAAGGPADQIRAAGASAVETVGFNALAFDTHERVIGDVFARFGDIDVVVVAFGVLGDQETAEKDTGAALEIVQTNYVGAVSACLAAAHHLKNQGHGTLVVLSSVAGERARKANFVYGSSKAGIDAFAQGLGDSLVGTGVSVLVVRPGFVKTKMTEGMKPAPLSTTPDVVADAVVSGIQRGAHTVWAPPPMRWASVVLRHLPRALFRKIPA